MVIEVCQGSAAPATLQRTCAITVHRHVDAATAMTALTRMRTNIIQLTVATSPDHERGVHADEAAGAGHQHRHRRRAVRVAGALARVLCPLRVKRHVRPLQQRSAPRQQPQAPRSACSTGQSMGRESQPNIHMRDTLGMATLHE